VSEPGRDGLVDRGGVVVGRAQVDRARDRRRVASDLGAGAVEQRAAPGDVFDVAADPLSRSRRC
jgi:hypothetical protein